MTSLAELDSLIARTARELQTLQRAREIAQRKVERHAWRDVIWRALSDDEEHSFAEALRQSSPAQATSSRRRPCRTCCRGPKPPGR